MQNTALQGAGRRPSGYRQQSADGGKPIGCSQSSTLSPHKSAGMFSMRKILPKIEDYPAHPEACWQEHLKPKAKDAPTVISLFAGCGGSSLGYSMAGYRKLLAVEWDDHSVETFRLNSPDVPVYHCNIAGLTVGGCMEMAGLSGPGELDVLDGSPPCQEFSTAESSERLTNLKEGARNSRLPDNRLECSNTDF